MLFLFTFAAAILFFLKNNIIYFYFKNKKTVKIFNQMSVRIDFQKILLKTSF